MNEETALPTLAPSQALTEVESHRAIQEVQAAMVIAKKFPRDQKAALDRILQAFARPKLAESALYSYSRGGTEVTGPSIRAAETIAQQWGNIQFGIRELEQRNGESTVEAFAWDVETNTRQVKVFQVPHVRYRRPDKGGSVKLDDPRDVYEMVANQGARRLRACILGVIPGDVIEDAINQAEVTLKTKIEITPDLLQTTLDRFAEYGVTKDMIETRIQRRFEAITPAQIVQLKKVYNSMRDGMSTPAEWFGAIKQAEEGDGEGASKKSGVSAFMDKTRPAGTTKSATPAPAIATEASNRSVEASGARGAADPNQPAQGAPTVAEVSALIQKGDLDAAADLARTFPPAERAALEMQIKQYAKKAAKDVAA